MAKLNEKVKRIMIAGIFVPLIIFSIFSDRFDLGIILLVLVCLSAFFGGLEILSFGKTKKIKVNPILSSIINISLPISAYLASKFQLFNFFHISMIIIFFGILIEFLLQVLTSNLDKVIESISINIFSFIYPGFLLSFIMVVKYEFSPWYLIYLFLICWGGDGGAYFIGSSFGKTKLNLPASPNKSLEGYIGGIFTALITALLVSKLIAPIIFGDIVFRSVIFNYLPLEILLILLLSFISFSGDLLESSFKRDVGKKDSYQILKLAGHGGVLDIIDSVVLIYPTFYVLSNLISYFMSLA